MLRVGLDTSGQNSGKTGFDEKCGPASGPVEERTADLIAAFMAELKLAGFSNSQIQKINEAMIRAGVRLGD